MNRFSKDQNAIDESLSQSMLTMLNQTFLAIGVFITIALVSPLFISLLLPIGMRPLFLLFLISPLMPFSSALITYHHKHFTLVVLLNFSSTIRFIFFILFANSSSPSPFLFCFTLFVHHPVYFFLFAQSYYLRTSRELQRLDSITKSPVFAQFSGMNFFYKKETKTRGREKKEW